MVSGVRYQEPAGSAPTAQNEPIIVERVNNLHKQACMIVEQLELIRSDVRDESLDSLRPVAPTGNGPHLSNSLDYMTNLLGEKHQRALELLREISEWV